MAAEDWTNVGCHKDTRQRLGEAKPYELTWDEWLNLLLDEYESEN